MSGWRDCVIVLELSISQQGLRLQIHRGCLLVSCENEEGANAWLFDSQCQHEVAVAIDLTLTRKQEPPRRRIPCVRPRDIDVRFSRRVACQSRFLLRRQTTEMCTPLGIGHTGCKRLHESAEACGRVVRLALSRRHSSLRSHAALGPVCEDAVVMAQIVQLAVARERSCVRAALTGVPTHRRSGEERSTWCVEVASAILRRHRTGSRGVGRKQHGGTVLDAVQREVSSLLCHGRAASVSEVCAGRGCSTHRPRDTQTTLHGHKKRKTQGTDGRQVSVKFPSVHKFNCSHLARLPVDEQTHSQCSLPPPSILLFGAAMVVALLPPHFSIHSFSLFCRLAI